MEFRKIINVAVIAHVDAGKSTLVDAFLAQSHVFSDHDEVVEQVMDSNDLERERGITIYSKNCSVNYKDYKINIVDTPGHADFSSEVERIIKTVDTVILLVDSSEGPMPQTRFVLKKSLEANLRPILLINKIDKKDQRAIQVIDEVYDLFLDLKATDDQLDFPILYGIAKEGIVRYEMDDTNNDIEPLFETIVKHVQPYPNVMDKPLRMQVSALAYDDYIGRIGIGRVYDGVIKANEMVTVCDCDIKKENRKIANLYNYQGLKRTAITEAQCGDIVLISGIDNIEIGDTICQLGDVDPMPQIDIEEPTMSMNFMVNSSPFQGKSGKFVTSRNIRERLERELEVNVGLKVEETDSTDTFKVSGRGELHLSILIETMRRQGYEFQVSRPQVITKEIDGVRNEPVEILMIEVPDEYVGAVMEKLGTRKAELVNMDTNGSGTTHIEFRIPSRGLMGYRPEFLTDTNGNGIMNHVFDAYEPWKGEIITRHQGSLIAWETGDTVAYGLNAAQERGRLFVGPGVPVYEGMIVGASPKAEDLTVNVCKKKHMTNTRASGSDDALKLTPPSIMSLEQCLEFIGDDELVEVTPKNIRMRKMILSREQRMKNQNRKK